MERQYKTPELIKTDSSIFEDAYEGSYYTIIGAGDDPMDWVNFMSDVLYKSEIGTPEVFYLFKGKDMDEYYKLTGNNRYQDNLTFLAFPLDGLNVNKLAMLKLRMEDHWFDDIVDDNARREHRFNDDSEEGEIFGSSAIDIGSDARKIIDKYNKDSNYNWESDYDVNDVQPFEHNIEDTVKSVRDNMEFDSRIDTMSDDDLYYAIVDELDMGHLYWMKNYELSSSECETLKNYIIEKILQKFGWEFDRDFSE